MNELERKTYLANSKYIGHVVKDYHDGATRIIICDDFCEHNKEKIQKIIDNISLFTKELFKIK